MQLLTQARLADELLKATKNIGLLAELGSKQQRNMEIIGRMLITLEDKIDNLNSKLNLLAGITIELTEAEVPEQEQRTIYVTSLTKMDRLAKEEFYPFGHAFAREGLEDEG